MSSLKKKLERYHLLNNESKILAEELKVLRAELLEELDCGFVNVGDYQAVVDKGTRNSFQKTLFLRDFSDDDYRKYTKEVSYDILRVKKVG